MTRPQKHKVELSEEQREFLLSLVSRGEEKARMIRRARILLLSDKGKIDREIAEILCISGQTVYNIRKKFAQGGLQVALHEGVRPGSQKKLDAKAEAHLIALVCSDPPGERNRWTVRLLTEKFVELGHVDEISRETIRRTLKKTTSNRGKKNSGA